nr:type I 3-dehydroquinate dehydratase [Pyrinomonadaceae bacterium]
MNNGKICVSVCAKTADELIEQIKYAENLADVIEIRFDCLEEEEFDSALQKINDLRCSKPFLATFRPKTPLAMFTCPLSTDCSNEIKRQKREAVEFRENGWHKIAKIGNVDFVDFESDLFFEMSTDYLFPEDEVICFSEETDKQLLSKTVIYSEHYFEKIPKN